VLRLIRLILLLAIAVQAAPLPSCAWLETLSGSSCHDADAPSVPAPADRMAQHCGSSHDVCACEKPQPLRDRSQIDRGLDLAPPSPAAMVVIAPCGDASADPAGARTLDPPRASVSLPLLS
jgi:hypothetical protein